MQCNKLAHKLPSCYVVSLESAPTTLYLDPPDVQQFMKQNILESRAARTNARNMLTRRLSIGWTGDTS